MAWIGVVSASETPEMKVLQAGGRTVAKSWRRAKLSEVFSRSCTTALIVAIKVRNMENKIGEKKVTGLQYGGKSWRM